MEGVLLATPSLVVFTVSVSVTGKVRPVIFPTVGMTVAVLTVDTVTSPEKSSASAMIAGKVSCNCSDVFMILLYFHTVCKILQLFLILYKFSYF